MAAKKKINSKEDPEAVIESALNRTELFIERNGKKLLIIIGVIVLIIGGYFGFEHLYNKPQSKRASEAMFMAQNHFAIDSFAMALNGNASMAGFKEIADRWSRTPEGNLARHYAGICYLHLGEFQNAIDYFNKFNGVGGAVGAIITANNYGLTGDAYIELGNMKKGIEMYEKAVAHSDNPDTAPFYLKKAAMANEDLGNNAKALEQFRTISTNYSQTTIARDIDKFIARVQQKL